MQNPDLVLMLLLPVFEESYSITEIIDTHNAYQILALKKPQAYDDVKAGVRKARINNR